MLLKVSAAAERAGVSRTIIYRGIRQKLLCPVEGIPYMCLRSEDVDAFIARPRRKPGPHPKPRNPRGRPRKQAGASPGVSMSP